MLGSVCPDNMRFEPGVTDAPSVVRPHIPFFRFSVHLNVDRRQLRATARSSTLALRRTASCTCPSSRCGCSMCGTMWLAGTS